ncbi:hypothetical protein [Streptomyces sp. NPDC085529]|uniref:hypothetical protein n=1 Tax=Streptomyces sp. NPDC085529 TaxID=3365729 RepID=UPI0037D510F9
MSSHEPGQGWPPPPQGPPQGPPQAGPAYGAYGAPQPPTAPPPSVPPGRTHTNRGAWIGAAATLVAAVIGVVGTFLVNQDDDDPQTAPAPVTTSAAPTPTADDKPTTDTPPSPATPDTDATPDTAAPAAEETTAEASPSEPAPGTVRWQGPLVISYTDDKDLDAATPVESESGRDNDFAVYPFGDHMLRPDNNAKALVWEGPKAPTHADCAGVVETLGTSNDIRLKTGLAVCGRTGDGRLVRLTVKKLDGLGSETNATFDVVVWN